MLFLLDRIKQCFIAIRHYIRSSYQHIIPTQPIYCHFEVRVGFLCVWIFEMIYMFGNIRNYSYITNNIKQNKMAKQCAKCGNTKETTQFSKKTKSKDGLQDRCKQCNKKDNHKFRTELNPEYQSKWYSKYMGEWTEYMNKYRKSDKLPIVYAIVAPNGFQYIGMTMMHLGVRKSEHIRHYKRALKGKRDRLPLLHDSFDQHGIDNHQFKVVKELPNFTRKQLREIESAYITLNKSQNISLNTRN